MDPNVFVPPIVIALVIFIVAMGVRASKSRPSSGSRCRRTISESSHR